MKDLGEHRPAPDFFHLLNSNRLDIAYDAFMMKRL